MQNYYSTTSRTVLSRNFRQKIYLAQADILRVFSFRVCNSIHKIPENKNYAKISTYTVTHNALPT